MKDRGICLKWLAREVAQGTAEMCHFIAFDLSFSNFLENECSRDTFEVIRVRSWSRNCWGVLFHSVWSSCFDYFFFSVYEWSREGDMRQIFSKELLRCGIEECVIHLIRFLCVKDWSRDMFGNDLRGKLLKEQLRSRMCVCVCVCVCVCMYLLQGSFANETIAGRVVNDRRTKLLKELLKRGIFVCVIYVFQICLCVWMNDRNHSWMIAIRRIT